MKVKRILINESQYKRLATKLKENVIYGNNIKRLIQELVDNYEPMVTGDSSINIKNVKRKSNDETISLVELHKSMCDSNSGLNKEFIKQVITDWFNGSLSDDGGLSKNVSLY